MKRIYNYMEAMLKMQIYNHLGQYDMSKEIYEQYQNIIPEDNVYLKNKFLNEYELSAKKFILNSKPRNLQVVLFDKCQFNCIMCNQKEKKHNYSLPEQYMEEIADLFPYLDSITWQGGEIFLWENFVKILQNVAVYKQISQNIVTNLQNINKETIKQLSQIPNIKLIISVDGTNKETYEQIRRGSSFKKLMENINLLNKYKLKYKSDMQMHINFVILKENFNEILNIVDFAKTHNFNGITFNECISTPDYSNVFGRETRSKIERMLDFAVVKAAKENICLTIHYSSKASNIAKSENIKKDILICKLPWYKLLLGEDYTFAPECTCFKRENYYINKNKLTISDMWNSGTMQNYRKHIIGLKENKKICNSKCRLYTNSYF